MKSHREGVAKPVSICGHDLALASRRIMKAYLMTESIGDYKAQINTIWSDPGQVGPHGAGR
jgi:hypothetical protein